MQNLRESGDNSFEELTARLLSKVAGERIRRCSAGTQGGIDALAEIPFAIQAKRYATPVRSIELEGALSAAASFYPDLQLWVLVATCRVGLQTQQKLVQAGLRQGIAVLVLDARMSESALPGVSALAALAATDVDTTIRALTDPTWRSQGQQSNRRLLRRELAAIQRLPGFREWETRLRTDLRQMVWRFLVRSQNERLYSTIVGDAANAFGTPYHLEEAVPRSAEEQLTAWSLSCATSDRCDVAVVTGDRYDGKTWLVYRWLSANLQTLPLPVFFFASSQVKREHGDLEKLVMDEVRLALGRFRRHADDVIDREKSRTASKRPWCIVIMDGANEYVADPEARARAILWAVPPAIHSFESTGPLGVLEHQQRVDQRQCALLMTCRTHDFEEDSSWLRGRVTQRVELGPYDEEEFRDALERRSYVPEQLAGLSESAARMVRRPRYLALVINHWSELGFFGAITTDVLHYLDASDKVVPRESDAVRWDPEAFKELLANLAVTWARERRLNRSTVREHLRGMTEKVDLSMAALQSEGILTHVDGTFVPDPDRLALGMGLFIWHELLRVRDDSMLTETLADILEPHRDDDEKVRWLRSSLTTSVIAGEIAKHPVIVQCLISAWLSSRNFSQKDLDDLRNLSPLLMEPVLQLISSCGTKISNVLLLAEPIIHAGIARHQSAVAEAIRRWCRLVPTGKHWSRGEEEHAPAEVALAASEPSFNDLNLEIAKGVAATDAHDRQRLGLFLACMHPSLIGPLDILALLATRNALKDDLDSGERFAVRKILSDRDRAWYEGEVRRWEAKTDALRTMLLRHLIVLTDREDLCDLLARLPESSYLSWGPSWLTRADLPGLAKSEDSKHMMTVAGRAGYIALDPASPLPPLSWRRELGKVAIARFAGSASLHAYRSVSRDDLDLEAIEPAVAAWAPEAGATIWRAFLSDIPRRIAAGEESWSWQIEAHAALLTDAERQRLLEVVLEARARHPKLEHAFRRAYLCVLAGSSASERLRLLLEHPFDLEWTDFYEVLAATANEELRRETFAAVRHERDPERLKRARYLLGYMGGAELSATDLERLIGELSNQGSRGDAEDAARFLLRHSRVHGTTSPEALGPLVHVAHSLSEAAWQYAAFFDRKRHPDGPRGAEWVCRAFSAPQTARSNGAEAGVADEVAVEQGIQHLSLQIEERLARSTNNTSPDQFPEGIAEEVGESVFNRWVDLLLSPPSYRVHTGLLMPVLRRALRSSHPSAKRLWALAYPFPRERFSSRNRFVVEGRLDWTLREIHDPALDGELTTNILQELIADCRSDSELISVAMGARLISSARLTEVVNSGLDSLSELDRAQARFIAGWMPENSALRAKLSAVDSSRWVQRVGERAVARLNRECFARDWLARFLSESRRPQRWAAGRLFLECSDVATPFWAPDVIAESTAPASRRAEAQMLVTRILKKVDDSDLRDNFMGYPVRQLSAVVPPWRTVVEWHDIHVTKPEEET